MNKQATQQSYQILEYIDFLYCSCNMLSARIQLVSLTEPKRSLWSSICHLFFFNVPNSTILKKSLRTSLGNNA